MNFQRSILSFNQNLNPNGIDTSNIMKESRPFKSIKNLANNPIYHPITAAPWKQLNFHQNLFAGMVLMVFRLKGADRNNIHSVASIGQTNYLLRKQFEKYLLHKDELIPYITKNNQLLCERDYMNEYEPNTLGYLLSKKTSQIFNFLSAKSIWNTIKKAAFLEAVTDPVQFQIQSALQGSKFSSNVQLATVISGVANGICNHWAGCEEGDYVGFILKRHPIDNMYPFQFVPWHGQSKHPDMKLLTYNDLNGFKTCGYYIPFGRVLFFEETMSDGPRDKELCFGTPEEGFRCISKNPEKLTLDMT